MAIKKNSKSPFLLYKGKPLVRCDNLIYYGNPGDKYVVLLQILDKHNLEGIETAKNISIKLISTDSTLKITERIKKSTEKIGLYPALSIASIWLERALTE